MLILMVAACVDLPAGMFLSICFMGRMSVVMFVLMLGFGGGGEPYLGRSLM